MLEELLAEIHNWFECDYLAGELTVMDGELTLPHGFVKKGQYYRIIGSVFNDGLHRYPTSDLTDEVFDGEVWALAVPKAGRRHRDRNRGVAQGQPRLRIYF